MRIEFPLLLVHAGKIFKHESNMRSHRMMRAESLPINPRDPEVIRREAAVMLEEQCLLQQNKWGFK